MTACKRLFPSLNIPCKKFVCGCAAGADLAAGGAGAGAGAGGGVGGATRTGAAAAGGRGRCGGGADGAACAFFWSLSASSAAKIASMRYGFGGIGGCCEAALSLDALTLLEIAPRMSASACIFFMR